MDRYDVIVAGAGPSGSRAAFQLASSGYKVLVLEARETAGHKLSCTGIIGRECMEAFDIDRDCVLQEARSARLFAPSGEYIRVSRDEAQAYIVDRPAFDRSLARRASDHGAEYRFSSHVTDISVTVDGVELSVESGVKSITMQGRAAIIASGFASNLPQKLGIARPKVSISGAQTLVGTKGLSETEVYFSHKIAPKFFAWLVPISYDRARAGLFASSSPGRHLSHWLDQLVAEGKVTSPEAKVSYGGIHLKPLSRSYSNRLLVVGDAAGQVKPTTGGGIYYSLLCADMAAEVMATALALGDLSARSLSRYEKLWKAKLGRELRIDYFARSLYNRLSDRRIDSIFRIARDHDIHTRLMESSYRSFDWHGEIILDGLKQFGPWRQLFGRYLPAYILDSIRGRSPRKRVK